MGISIQDRAQKTLSSIPRQAAIMDRANEFPLHDSAFWPARHSRKKKSPGKLFGCLLAFCLLAVFLLALPVTYLLSRHLGEPPACKVEEGALRNPGFQKLIGTPPATELKPRIHLTVHDPYKLTCVPGEFPVLQWRYDQAFRPNLGDKIKYENGSLVITKPGDYFVYAQVTFRNQSTEKDNCGMGKTVTHVMQIIWKRSLRYPAHDVLLKSSHSIGEMQNWNHAIYLGGVVSLKEDDRVFVNVSSAKLVYDKGGVTFFGAFLV